MMHRSLSIPHPCDVGPLALGLARGRVVASCTTDGLPTGLDLTASHASLSPNSTTPTSLKLHLPGKFRGSRRNGIWALARFDLAT